MSEDDSYIINGGIEGVQRLKILARVISEDTCALLDKANIKIGSRCIDIGCGGGVVTTELAKRTGPEGQVVGIDFDEKKLEIARQEAQDLNFNNIAYFNEDVRKCLSFSKCDLAYSRFLLTHLSDPNTIIRNIYQLLKPGGKIVIEDIDCDGFFTYPRCSAFERFKELYCEAAIRHGGDPHIGSKLPGYVKRAGFSNVQSQIVQRMGTDGEVKLIAPITMQNIADTLLDDGLVTSQEIDTIITELYEFAIDAETLAGMPRMLQVVGTKAYNS